MFKALQTLLAACASLSVFLVANDNGTITVTVIPKPKNDGDNASLNTPLTLTGTAEELDAEFAGIMSSYSEKRLSLAEQLAVTETILDAAKKESATKATQGIKKAAAPGKASASTVAGDDDDEDEGSAPAAPIVAGAAKPAETAVNLFA